MEKLKISDGSPENDIPSILYKYRNWKTEYHSKMLTDNEVYFASPKDFNDPFDCRITQRFVGRTMEQINDYKDQLAISMFEESERQRRNFDEDLKRLDKKMDDIISFQKLNDDSHFHLQDIFYGILSLSKIWDNILMWSHYSNNHKGFCVGIKGPSLLSLKDDAGKGGVVDYQDDYPDIYPKVSKTMTDLELITYSFVETHTKSRKWSYEQEYRVSKNYFRRNPTDINRRNHLPSDSIAEIILGVSISSDDKGEILKIAEGKGIPVFQAIKVPFKFEITREQIQ